MTAGDRTRRLTAELAALRDLDAAGERARASALQAIRSLPRPLDADADPAHVTASAIVLGRRGAATRVVLHHHKRLRAWLQPGGHIDPGECPAAAALREAREETGLVGHHPRGGPWLLDVDVHELPRPCRPWQHMPALRCTHVDLRYLLWADGEPSPPPDESPRVRWFPWDEALGVADAGLARSLRRATDAASDTVRW